MRLIDADNLYDTLEQYYKSSGAQSHVMARDCLDAVCNAPTVEAVPLDKLCELLAENSTIPCEYCQYFSNHHCTAIGDTNKPCPKSADSWRNTLTKWMEGLDAEVH